MSPEPFELEPPAAAELHLVPVEVAITELSHTQLRLRIHRLLGEVADLQEELRSRSRGEFTPPRTDEQVETSRRDRTGDSATI